MTLSSLTGSIALVSGALFLATLPASGQVANARDDSRDPVQLRADPLSRAPLSPSLRFSSGADFIGSAMCSSRARVAASGVFLAPGSITNVDVIQAPTWGPGQIRFPLIATY